MSEKEFENVKPSEDAVCDKEKENLNILSADAADNEPATVKVSEENAEKVVGGDYEDPSVQGADGGGAVAGIFFIPVTIMVNANVMSNFNAAANLNAAMNANAAINANAVTNANANVVANANAAFNANASVNVNTVDDGTQKS